MQQSLTDSTGANRGSLHSYTIGFLSSVVLTAVAYGLVLSDTVSPSTAIDSIIGLAIAQILVHLHFFLHLDNSSSTRWNLLAIVFTFLIVLLFVGGSLWIMHHLSYRLM